MRDKIEALMRGLGAGFLPEPMVRAQIEAGRLVVKQTARSAMVAHLHYAWRTERGPLGLGRALQWWLQQLESPATRRALLERHASLLP
jgi:DNA-binding transcriptional LysR family regulator